MIGAAILDGMAKKSKAPLGRPRNPNPVVEVRLFAEIDERLKTALETLAKQEGRTMKAQLIRILESKLIETGHWPPPADE